MSNATQPVLKSSDGNVNDGSSAPRSMHPGRLSSFREGRNTPQNLAQDESSKSGKAAKEDLQDELNDADTGRFASLKRKLTRKRLSGGFLLDRPRTDTQFSTPSDPSPKVQTLAEKGLSSPQSFGRHGSPVLALDNSLVPEKQRTPGHPGTIANGHAQSHVAGVENKTIKADRSVQSASSSSSGRSTIGSSPSSKSKHEPEGRMDRISYERQRPASATIDSNQLVRIALNLSESRRMHLDPGHLPSIAIPTERRVTSAASATHRSYLSSSPTEHRQSSSKSKTTTPSRGTTPRSRGRTPTHPSLLSSTTESDTIAIADEQPEYVFSPATVSRVQHAKAYFLLSNEYRRLLQSLPPLRPYHHAVDGSRISALGRPYNTLQYLRNRDTRSDLKAMLNPKANGWNNLDQVKSWVDAVEDEAGQPGYIDEDVALLPQWSSGIPRSTNPDSEGLKTGQPATGKRKDRRLMPRDDWSVDPSDLLADAYWLEQDDHKRHIVSRRGQMIFNVFHAPKRATRSNTLEHSREDKGDIETHDFVSPRSVRTGLTTARTSVESDGYTDTDGEIQIAPGKSKTGRMKRTLLGRSRSHTLSSETESDDERVRKRGTRERSRVPKPNIGPLEKHMQAMIDQDSRNGSPTDFSPTSPRLANEGQRRAGFSEESANILGRGSNGLDHEEHHLPTLQSPNVSSPATPRISVENYDRPTSLDAGQNNEPPPESAASQKPKETVEMIDRASRLGFFRRHKKQDTGFSGRNDSVTITQGESDSLTGGGHYNNIPNPGGKRSEERKSFEDSEATKQPETGRRGHKNTASNSGKRFFKGGRIGEIVRTESNQVSDVVFKRQSPRNASRPVSRDVSGSDTENQKSRAASPKRRPAQLLPPSPGRNRRSSSTNDLKALGTQRYHIKNLPSFLPSNSATTPDERSPTISAGQDHIARQLDERRLQRNESRFSRLAPPRLDTESEDVSPTTSSPDLTRQHTRESYGFPSSQKSPFGALSVAQSRGKRLNDMLSPPGVVGISGRGRAPTGLSSYEPKRDPSARPPALGPRSWNAARTKMKPQLAISEQDVALVRSQLLSSGVKAQSIVRLANAPRQQPPAFLRGAFDISGQSMTSIGPISRRQEHIVAAKILSKHLSSTLTAFDSSVVHFRNDTCNALSARIDDLRDRATSTLMPQLRSLGDDADGFVARLTTTHTLAIKQVNDNVDLMLRKRRRRLRYFQRGAFTVLEWILVGIMWLIWALVLALRVLRGSIWFMAWGVKWLLWLS